MEGTERRERLIEILSNQSSPVSGTELAQQLGVSRQVIVQDIALLRATNRNILSTTKGYLLYYQEPKKVNRCFFVRHTTNQIEDELNTMVDLGGTVLDVIVCHDIYGMIQADLLIHNRQDVRDFVNKIKHKKTVPLKELTADCHYHTVEADTEEILQKIELALKEKGYLLEEK